MQYLEVLGRKGLIEKANTKGVNGFAISGCWHLFTAPTIKVTIKSIWHSFLRLLNCSGFYLFWYEFALIHWNSPGFFKFRKKSCSIPVLVGWIGWIMVNPQIEFFLKWVSPSHGLMTWMKSGCTSSLGNLHIRSIFIIPIPKYHARVNRFPSPFLSVESCCPRVNQLTVRCGKPPK